MWLSYLCRAENPCHVRVLAEISGFPLPALWSASQDARAESLNIIRSEEGMDDLLQRMLAIDQEAEKLIQAAEAEAAGNTEALRLEINVEREKAQAALVSESPHLSRGRPRARPL